MIFVKVFKILEQFIEKNLSMIRIKSQNHLLEDGLVVGLQVAQEKIHQVITKKNKSILKTFKKQTQEAIIMVKEIREETKKRVMMNIKFKKPQKFLVLKNKDDRYKKNKNMN